MNVREDWDPGDEMSKRRGRPPPPTKHGNLIPYPGGKHYGRRTIASRLPLLTASLVSPFLGGGSVELYLEARGVRVHGSDIFAPLVNLWRQALSNPAQVAEMVEERYLPPTPERYRSALQGMASYPEGPAQAAATYGAYRMAFSSAVGGWAGFSKSRKRLTASQTQALRDFAAPGLSAERMDWRAALDTHPDETAYLDPPYPFQPSRLYQSHRECDWQDVLAYLKTRRAPWLLSMPDLPEVRDGYRWARVESVSWYKTMARTDGGRAPAAELLISNY